MLNLHQKCQGIAKDSRAVSTYARSYTQKNVFLFLGPTVRLSWCHPIYKNLVENNTKM